MIEKQSIEQLIERSKLEEVAGQFMDLSTRGANRKGICPFCQEKKKFSISVPKQLFKCFACGEGGHGALNFLMKSRGLTYLKAVQWLADFYKFELAQTDERAEGATGTIDTTYFDRRMVELGYKQDRPEDKGLFRPHSSGGIEIRFPALTGDAPWQQCGKEGSERDFVRLRLHETRITGSQKYAQDADTGIHIFIPPSVVAMHRAGIQCPVLYMVEGEFKAFAMAEAGLPIIGICGISMYHRAKGSKELHPDIMELLRVFRCAAAVLIHDADCKAVKWDPLADADKDLGKRLKDFAGAVTGFRMALGSLVQRVYFTHIRPEYIDKAKGLDDLAQLRGKDDVAEHLQRMKSTDMLSCKDITDMTWRGINGEFHLNMHRGVPTAFYDANQSLIGERSFNFLGGIYRYDLDKGEGGELLMEQHPDSKYYKRIGCDYYRIIEKLDEHDKAMMELVPWKESIINKDYVNRGYRNFYDTIETFDAFDTAPAHHDDYKPFIETETGRLYNRYKPLSRQPQKGSWDTIKGYLQHIFTERIVQSIDEDGKVVGESPAWIAYMDYWTVMYRFPLVRLPGVALVSAKKKTGKSKLLELNCAMWEGNATMLGNDELNDDFNGDWVSSQFAGVDETLLDKKHQQEKMKRRITGFREQMRTMYKDRERTKLIAKFHFTSNNVDNFINIDDDEFRYWIIEVGDPKRKDNKLLQKMIAEIPALFHELKTRTIVHPDIGRLWFADSVLETDARKNVASNSKGWCENDIRGWLQDKFYNTRWPELYFTVTQVANGVNDNNGTKYRRSEFTRVLKSVMKVEERFKSLTQPMDPTQRAMHKKLGEEDKQRWFLFRAEDFIPMEHAAEIMEEAKAEWAISPMSVDNQGNEQPFPLIMKHELPSLTAA